MEARTRLLTGSAMLGASAIILSYIEFNMPLTPAFAKMDFSDLPALIAAFAYGPLSGLMVEFVKNLVKLFASSTGGIGEFANFLIGAAFVLPAGIIYKRKKTRGMAILGMAAGILIMASAAAFLNYFVLLPLYTMFMPMDQIIGMFSEFIPFIEDRLDVCLFSAFPTTLLKGILVSAITLAIYKKLRPILRG